MMQTRCPACGTAFRITAEQLKIRQGQVRCGRCQQIFNALETLVDRPVEAVADPLETGGAQVPATAADAPDQLPAAAAAEANAYPEASAASVAVPETHGPADAPAAPHEAEAGAEEGLSGQRTGDDVEAAVATVADDFDLGDLDLDQALQRVAQELVPGATRDFAAHSAAATPAVESEAVATTDATDGADAVEAAGVAQAHADCMNEAVPPTPAPAPAKATASTAHTLPNIDAAWSSVASTTEAAMPQDLPFEAYEKARRQRPRGWLWYSLDMLLLVLLLAQMALHFRVELGVLIPESRPGFARLCALVGCELPLPHKPDLLSISSSDLHPQAGLPGQFRLLASLRNRAPFAQEYPHLELTLTDIVDQPLLRKVIAPGVYLAPGVVRHQGFAAGAELSLQLALKVDTRTHAAAGYRLYVFYP